MGAWIEIGCTEVEVRRMLVAPLVGAWIEIETVATIRQPDGVAPLVGAWIEIGVLGDTMKVTASLPLWERGLKSKCHRSVFRKIRRSPCGSVD